MRSDEQGEVFSDTKEVVEAHRFETSRLVSYLSEKIPGFRRPLEVRQFKGGQSNPTYQLITPNRNYVLRRKPPGKLLPSAHAVDREFTVTSALYAAGFPVARPYVLCEDKSVIGTMFYVMDYVEGRIFWNALLPQIDPIERSAIYDALNETLARLHSINYVKTGLEHFGKPGNYIARQITRWTKQYQSSETEQIDEMNRLIEWLPKHVPPGEQSCVVHGDYRLDNVIFHPHEPKVLAVLDWELSTIGDPLADFSYHLMPWQMPSGALGANTATLLESDIEALGIPGIEKYVGTYCRRTRREEVPNMNYYAAYNFFKLAGILQGIVKRAHDGTASSANAISNAAAVRPLAERAWYFGKLAGAPG